MVAGSGKDSRERITIANAADAALTSPQRKQE
jgi:hypothetical protein